MQELEIMEFPGTDYILENFEYYKNKFISDSVLVFRNANLNKIEQKIFHDQLGEKFGWFSNEFEEEGSYIENHSHNPLLESSGPDDIMLNWHIEHVYMTNPICGATWNMYNFNTDENNGKTYFIDSSKIYEELPEDWKIFLEDCIADAGDRVQTHPDDPKANDYKLYKPVKNHWITGKKVIRIYIDSPQHLCKLSTYKNNIPTKEEQETFEEISKYFVNKVVIERKGLMVHKWNKGDLLIPDMFKLVHAVTGGFDPKDREFCGKWGYQYPLRSINSPE